MSGGDELDVVRVREDGDGRWHEKVMSEDRGVREAKNFNDELARLHTGQ